MISSIIELTGLRLLIVSVSGKDALCVILSTKSIAVLPSVSVSTVTQTGGNHGNGWTSFSNRFRFSLTRCLTLPEHENKR